MESLFFSSVQPEAHMNIQQTVQSNSPFRKLNQVPVLQAFSEGIEQGPNIPLIEGVMPGLSPLMKHRWNVPVAAHADVDRTND